MWLYYPYTTRDDLMLASLGFRISIDQLYTGVSFDTQG